MALHRNARLGLAGRRALVARCRVRLLVPGGGETPRRLADDGVQVVAALVARRRSSSGVARLSRGSLVAAAPCPRLLPALSRHGSARPGVAAAGGRG